MNKMVVVWGGGGGVRVKGGGREGKVHKPEIKMPNIGEPSNDSAR